MTSITKKSDALGAIASSLCLAHCFITPIIFVIQTCTQSCCGSETGVPKWWLFLDYFFLGISFLAILWSSQTTSKNWMKIALWFSWLALLLVIVNERFVGIQIHQLLGYVPALALVFLHLYNRKYCKCIDENYCTSTKTKSNKR
jgi:hypothetical protein